MKTGDISRHLGVSDTTIRRWVKEFETFFSDAARRAESKQRVFTGADFVVMATINELSNGNFSLAEIYKRLSEGYRVQDTTAATVGYEDGRLVPAAAVEQIIDATELRVALEQVKAERDKLADMLNQASQEVRRLQSQQEELRGNHSNELKELNQQIRELERQLGLAMGELNYRRELDKRERGD